jgi:protein ImuA
MRPEAMEAGIRGRTAGGVPPAGPGLDGTRSARLTRLRAHIRAIEGGPAIPFHAPSYAPSYAPGKTPRDITTKKIPLPGLDDALPWGGLPQGALHEVMADDPGAATGFCAMLLARLLAPGDDGGDDGAAVLWCEGAETLDAGGLYGPGLARFGLDPARLVLVTARRDADLLWAMEEGLRGRAMRAVIGAVRKLPPKVSRRLQLAAEATGGTAFLLTRPTDRPPPSVAVTRWRIDAAPSDDAELAAGRARWQVRLFRCRGAAPRHWMVEWRDETGDFAVLAELRDRSPVSRPTRMAG